MFCHLEGFQECRSASCGIPNVVHHRSQDPSSSSFTSYDTSLANPCMRYAYEGAEDYHTLIAHAGKPLYEKERERIMGQRAKRTARLAQGAARRNHALAIAYSLSIAASYLIIVADSMHTY